MSRAIYLTAMGPASGKSLVALGLVELVSHRVSRVGFFRPIVQSLPDNDLELVRARYRLPDERVGYAFIAEHLRSLLSASRDEADAGMAQAVAVYKQLEARVRPRRHRGHRLHRARRRTSSSTSTPASPATSARPSSPSSTATTATVGDIVETVRVSEESLVGQGDSVLALIVNRVPPKVHGELVSRLAGEPVTAAPVWALPEDDALRYPTLAELGDALAAELVAGDPDDLTREVRHVKVAAMSVPNLLDHVEDGTVLITPGDRPDVIVTAALTRHSAAVPSVAGVVLSGGLRPDDRVTELIAGLRRRRQAAADVRRRRRHVRHGDGGGRGRGADHRRQRAQDRRRARPVRGPRRPRPCSRSASSSSARRWSRR